MNPRRFPFTRMDLFGQLKYEGGAYESARALLNAEASRSALVKEQKNGGDVSDALVRIESDVARIRASMPRGHIIAFVFLCAVTMLLAVGISSLYAATRPIVTEIWGPLSTWDDHYYLVTYRGWSSTIYALGAHVLPSYWTLLVTAGLLILLYPLQRSLPRLKARLLIRLMFTFALVTSAVFTFSVFGLLTLPLA